MLKAEGIVKGYGGTRALDDVDFEAQAGEIHAIVGQNGAGKSTLMSILAGEVQPDAGRIFLDGAPVRMESPLRAMGLAVAMVHQRRQVVPELSVAENIFLGRLPKTALGLLNRKKLLADARESVARLGFDLDVRQRVGTLRAAGRQLTEIARALSMSAKVLILDEPSAVLCRTELESLFRIIRKLRDEGKTILYVSHHLSEVFEIADRATVLKDGRTVGTYDIDCRIDQRFLISRMVGSEWSDQPRGKSDRHGAEILRIEGLTGAGAFEDISLTLRAGEILGMAGLIGSGVTELCRAIFGAMPYDRGSIFVRGVRASISSPRDGLGHGIAYLSEDRGGEGIIGQLPVYANLTIAALGRFATGGILKRRAEEAWAHSMVRRVGVRCAGLKQLVAQLSGGNQQKVALGKWLSADARIFLLDHPTAGVDVAAKSEIHSFLVELAANGAAILVSSSDLPELLTLCDRIMVMSRGRIVRELYSEKTTEKEILYYANRRQEGTEGNALRN